MRILKAARENHHVMYKGVSFILIGSFSSETMEAKKQWNNIKYWKKNDCQLWILYPAKPFFKNKDKSRHHLEKEMATHSSTLAWGIL